MHSSCEKPDALRLGAFQKSWMLLESLNISFERLRSYRPYSQAKNFGSACDRSSNAADTRTGECLKLITRERVKLQTPNGPNNL